MISPAFLQFYGSSSSLTVARERSSFWNKEVKEFVERVFCLFLINHTNLAGGLFARKYENIKFIKQNAENISDNCFSKCYYALHVCKYFRYVVFA